MSLYPDIDGFESACRGLPANAVHDVAPFPKKPRKP